MAIYLCAVYLSFVIAGLGARMASSLLISAITFACLVCGRKHVKMEHPVHDIRGCCMMLRCYTGVG